MPRRPTDPPRNNRTPSWQDWHAALRDQLAIARARDAASDEDAIHRIRSSLKVMRALLRLAPASVKTEVKHLRQTLQTIAKGLAQLRDESVVFETLNALGLPDTARPHTGFQSEAKAALHLAREALASISMRLDRLTDIPDDSARMMKAFKRYARRLEAKEPSSWKKAKIKKLHAYRTALIIHACQARFMEPWLDRSSKPNKARLDRLRSLLGELNDLDRLIAFSRQKTYQSLFASEPALLERAHQRQQKLRKKLERLH